MYTFLFNWLLNCLIKIFHDRVQDKSFHDYSMIIKQHKLCKSGIISGSLRVWLTRFLFIGRWMDDDAERIGYIGCRPILVFVVHCGIEWVLKVPVTDERNSQTRYMSVYFQSSKWFWFEFQPVNQPKYVSLGRASCLVNKHTHTQISAGWISIA